MRASVIEEQGPPSVLTYRDVADPVVGPHEVLVQVQAIGVQGGDTLYRSGHLPVPALPFVVGYQAAGTIAEIGSSVDLYRPGDRVVAMLPAGSHAELASAHQDNVFPVPDGVSIVDAGCVPAELGTAAEAVFTRGRLTPGQSVLVTAAAGGVGLAAVQMARHAGAGLIVATATSPERTARLLQYGADVVVDPTRSALESVALESTEGRGVDLVVEQVGGDVFSAAARALAPGGTLAWVGIAGRQPSTPDLWPLLGKNATIEAVHLGNARNADPERIRRLIAGVFRLVADGDVRIVVDSTFPLSEAAAAHAHVESRRAFGRVVLTP